VHVDEDDAVRGIKSKNFEICGNFDVRCRRVLCWEGARAYSDIAFLICNKYIPRTETNRSVRYGTHGEWAKLFLFYLNNISSISN
jgi:hypothetical protein